MRACVCVSTTWHAATLVSLHSLNSDRLYISRASTLPAWLCKYGPAANISRLDLQLQQDPSTKQTDDNVVQSPRSVTALLDSRPARLARSCQQYEASAACSSQGLAAPCAGKSGFPAGPAGTFPAGRWDQQHVGPPIKP
jgi:hypothetical protein